MSLFNNFNLVGRVHNDLELKEVKGGFKNCRITVVTEDENPRTGKKEVTYVDCTLWQGDAEKAVSTLKKGSVIALWGKLKQERWTDPSTNLERSKHVLDIKMWFSMEEMNMNTVIKNNPLFHEQPKVVPTKPVAPRVPTSSSFNDGPPLVQPPMDEELPF